MSSESKPFKQWFDREAARSLAAQVGRASRSFDRASFVRRASRGLSKLEMGARVRQFADALRAELPDSVPRALKILTRSLPAALPDCESPTDGWLQWPVGQFIADHGLPHFEVAMEAMIELTQRFSSEFAVRPFVEHRPEETIARLLALTDHQSPHVRRWCSEGVRPRLPWGKKLAALATDPTPIWPILEALKDDEALYVRRSVANTLGDIAKDHPDLAVARARAWSKGATVERTWVIKHGLRALIKDGHPDALAAVGYGPPRGLSATLRIAPRKVAVGGHATLSATLSSSIGRAQPVLVDYVVHYARPTGRASRKVFKWTKGELRARGELELSKRHPMRDTTIRSLHPGTHRVELQVNGVRVAEARFTLTSG